MYWNYVIFTVSPSEWLFLFIKINLVTLLPLLNNFTELENRRKCCFEPSNGILSCKNMKNCFIFQTVFGIWSLTGAALWITVPQDKKEPAIGSYYAHCSFCKKFVHLLHASVFCLGNLSEMKVRITNYFKSVFRCVCMVVFSLCFWDGMQKYTSTSKGNY